MGTVNDEILGNALIAVGKRVKAGKCEMTQEQMDQVFNGIQDAVDIPISKEQACSMLGISRSTFDAKVLAGELPKGQHRRGFKELVYYKRDIIKYSKEKERDR